jgi:hypothetical protein
MATKAPRTRKVKKPPAAAPKRPAPRSGFPNRAPRGFDTRTHQLVVESRDHERGQAHGPGPGALRARYRDMLPAPTAGKDGGRLAKLAKETRAGAAQPVRSDYFGTAEHKALGDALARILAGESVIEKVEGDPSHALLHRAGGANLVLDEDPIPLSSLTVAGTGSAWLQQLRASLADALVEYEPNRDLFVRPGLTLRYGDVIALAGDYFATPEELRAELTPEVASAIRGVTPDSTGTTLLNTHRGWVTYLDLANKNQVHFTPRNWVTFARYHAEALRLALRRSYEAALFENAFADHFLSDAFASGHLRVPREKLAGLKGALPSRLMHNEENENGLWAQDLAGNVWRAYGDEKLGTSQVHIVLTAYAVAVSLQRVQRAYRLEGAAATELADALEAGLARLPTSEDERRWGAGMWRTPADLPDFLGPVAGLPDVRARIPAPVGWSVAPEDGKLANYPPRRWLDEDGSMQGRGSTPDFAAFFDLGGHDR